MDAIKDASYLFPTEHCYTVLPGLTPIPPLPSSKPEPPRLPSLPRLLRLLLSRWWPVRSSNIRRTPIPAPAMHIKQAMRNVIPATIKPAIAISRVTWAEVLAATPTKSPDTDSASKIELIISIAELIVSKYDLNACTLTVASKLLGDGDAK